MRDKLSKSKNVETKDITRLYRTADYSRNKAKNKSSIITQLDNQIENYQMRYR